MMLKNFIHNKNAPFAVVLVGVLLYIIGFTILTFWKLHHFYYDNLDLAIFNNVFFNTLQGHPFVATIHPPSYLGDHFSPIIFLLVGIYALKPGPEILLFMQTVALAASAIPIYCISRIILKKHVAWFSAFPALLWLVNPLVHNINFFEFELVPFAVFFLFITMYFYMREKKILFLIFMILSLMVREDIALITLFISGIAWIEKRSLFWKLFPLAFSIVYLSASFPIISFFNAVGSYKFLIFYSWLGGHDLSSVIMSFLSHPIKVFLHILTMQNLQFLLGLTFPFLFLVFTPSRYLLLLLAPLAQIELAGVGGSATIIMTHYSGLFIVALMLVFITQMQKIADGSFQLKLPKILQKRSLMLIIIAGAPVYASLTYGSIVPVIKAWQINNQQEQKKELVAKIPPQASVAATFELMTQLSTREKIYSLHYAVIGKNQYAQTDYTLSPDTQYLAIDWQDFLKAQIHFSAHHSFGAYAQNVPENLRAILNLYDRVAADGSIMIFKKADEINTHDDLAVFKQLPGDDIGTRQTMITKIDHGDTALTVHLAIMPASDDAKYYLTVTTSYREFMLPIAYALPITSGAKNYQEIIMPVYVKADEQKTSVIKLYRWHKGYLQLSQLKNLDSVFDGELLQTCPVTEPCTR